ncbi:MAG TPA: hypothetical protein VLD59_11965 [Steroidobacteraceae bacterium]|nr:hypothetical protein [Steroidobacteraceae bacterium]
MNRSLSCLFSVAMLSATPLTIHAAEPALETCSQTFIAHLAAAHGPAHYRFAPTPGAPIGDSPSTRMKRVEIDLVARATSTGKVIATAACTATVEGELIAMTLRPAGSTHMTPTRISARDTP